MESFYFVIGWSFVIGLFALFTQIYFWRRKVSRMADDDVRDLDPAEWRRHVNFSRYVKLVSRLLWALCFSIAAGNYITHPEAPHFYALVALTMLLAIIFIGWALAGFRWDRLKIDA